MSKSDPTKCLGAKDDKKIT